MCFKLLYLWYQSTSLPPRLGPSQFYMVTGCAALQHVTSWLDRHLPKVCLAPPPAPQPSPPHLHHQGVTVRDITKEWGVLNLQGPRSREVLGRFLPSLPSLPFSHGRWEEVAGEEVLVLRLTYVGELGYELHVPNHHCRRLLEALEEEGAIRLGGMEVPASSFLLLSSSSSSWKWRGAA